jgi:hypothetical protein
MNLAKTLKKNRSLILRLAKKYGAIKIRVFGSVARGEANNKSDVDLLVKFKSTASLLDQIALTQDLEALLEKKVDVVSEKAIHWYLRKQILNEAAPL